MLLRPGVVCLGMRERGGEVRCRVVFNHLLQKLILLRGRGHATPTTAPAVISYRGRLALAASAENRVAEPLWRKGFEHRVASFHRRRATLGRRTSACAPSRRCSAAAVAAAAEDVLEPLNVR